MPTNSGVSDTAVTVEEKTGPEKRSGKARQVNKAPAVTCSCGTSAFGYILGQNRLM